MLTNMFVHTPASQVYGHDPKVSHVGDLGERIAVVDLGEHIAVVDLTSCMMFCTVPYTVHSTFKNSLHEPFKDIASMK